MHPSYPPNQFSQTEIAEQGASDLVSIQTEWPADNTLRPKALPPTTQKPFDSLAHYHPWVQIGMGNLALFAAPRV